MKNIGILIILVLCLGQQRLLGNVNHFMTMDIKIISLEEARVVLKQDCNATKIVKSVLGRYKAKNGCLLKDGRSVLFFDTYAWLVPFVDLYNDLLKADSVLLSPPPPEKIIADKNVYLKIFNDYFESEEYDFTLKSLLTIDDKYTELEKDGIREADMFLPMVCYLGEVLSKETNGRWEVKKEKIYEYPIIQGSDDKAYDSYFCVQKIITGSHKKFSFYSAIESQLKPVKLNLSATPIINDPELIKLDGKP